MVHLGRMSSDRGRKKPDHEEADWRGDIITQAPNAERESKAAPLVSSAEAFHRP